MKKFLLACSSARHMHPKLYEFDTRTRRHIVEYWLPLTIRFPQFNKMQIYGMYTS